MRIVIVCIGAVFFLGASCGKKTKQVEGKGGETGAIDALDRAEDGNKQKANPNMLEMPGLNLPALSSVNKKSLTDLSLDLKGPCGKVESLYSAAKKSNCKKAKAAIVLLAELVKDGQEQDLLKEIYESLFFGKKYDFDLKGTPRLGPADAPIRVVEFYDYGCVACMIFSPKVFAMVKAHPKNLAVYFKQFPLSQFKPKSDYAAQAALAAYKQGKFVEYHKWLFQNSKKHEKSALRAQAKALGMDMERFDRDYQAAGAIVVRDSKEGEKSDVGGTPTIFLNGRQIDRAILNDSKYRELVFDAVLAE